MLVFAVVVTAALALVSFALSYAGLVHVAAWAAVPGALAWAVPVVVDGAQLVFTAGMLVHRARGEPTARSWAALVAFAAVSVAGNGLHAWDAGDGSWRALVGVVVAGLAPVAVVLSVHELASLVVARPAPTPVPETAETSAVDERIRSLREAGHTVRAIADAVGVSRSTVSRRLAAVPAVS